MASNLKIQAHQFMNLQKNHSTTSSSVPFHMSCPMLNFIMENSKPVRTERDR